MTNDDKELADGLRLLANTARKMSWVGHNPMLAPKVLNKSADRIEALSAENERLREVLRSAIRNIDNLTADMEAHKECGECQQNIEMYVEAISIYRAALGEQP